jgi:membrane-associated PAP2 superfamily phosphatase
VDFNQTRDHFLKEHTTEIEGESFVDGHHKSVNKLVKDLIILLLVNISLLCVTLGR